MESLPVVVVFDKLGEIVAQVFEISVFVCPLSQEAGRMDTVSSSKEQESDQLRLAPVGVT
jgi:hypothetical protein